MTRLPLTYAGMLYYDRTLGLLTGQVRPERIDLAYGVFDWPGDLFRIQCQEAPYEVSEMSMSSYLVMLGRGDRRFVGLPLFVSRNFRHSQIDVSAQRGITSPTDLVGKWVGVSQYQMTAALWIRGIL